MILLSVDYRTYPVKSYHIQELKSLTRYYKSLVKKRSKELVVLTNILDLVFPEFKPFFKNKFSQTAYFILQHYHTPERIARISYHSFEQLHSLSKGRLSYARFLRLKDLAKNTVGSSSELLVFEMKSCIRLIRNIDQEIKTLESLLKAWSLKIDSPVFSIKGIGFVSALSLIAEYGNFTSFDSPAKMLSFAGLEPSIIQSGISNKQGHMVKRGSGYLRDTLMNLSIPFMMHNPVIYDYYLKKKNEGKPHRVALSHVAKKLLRIIFFLVKSNVQFNETKLA
jgi:transposase